MTDALIPTPATCTVVVAHDARCGKPAVTSFTSKRDGRVFAECAEHAAPGATLAARVDALDVALAPHPKTRSTAPLLLVRSGAIVGYAHKRTLAVERRADKLGAVIVRNTSA